MELDICCFAKIKNNLGKKTQLNNQRSEVRSVDEHMD